MKVCLITPGQPSTNPRLVKEADTLAEAGFDVSVICGFWADWARRTDLNLLASRPWRCVYVGGDPQSGQLRYYWTRFRNGVARRLIRRMPAPEFLERWAADRVLPELITVAKRTKADLYIAHNLAALPAAVAAAESNGAAAGFDAEDLHSAMVAADEMTSADYLAAKIEAACLPRCRYVTAASRGIAEAYRARYGIPLPATILNVFPLSQRPSKFRPTSRGTRLTLYWFSQTIGWGEGLEDIVAAMGLVADGSVELHLRGVWMPGYEDFLRRVAASAGVNPARLIHHPLAPPEEMVRLAAAYDVGLSLQMPTCINYDICLTNKLFTYILAGNAVLATTTEGQQPILSAIGNAGTGYDPGDVQRLAQYLARWSRDRESLEAARRRAWDCGTEVYNWDLEKRKFLDVISRAVERSSTIEDELTNVAP